MSSHARESTNPESGKHGMDIEQEPGGNLPADQTSSARGRDRSRLAVVLRDSTNWLSDIRSLRETDVIILLTPVVSPVSQHPESTSDPFEPLGRSLASRHARIRHVPYTQRNGITSTHLGFIKRGAAIILCFALQPDERIQFEFADVAFAVSDNKPCIIVVCCNQQDTQLDIPFPTVIQTMGYSPPALEATAALIFGEDLTGGLSGGIPQPRLWPVEQWNEARDMPSVLDLWSESMCSRFPVDYQTLTALLRRPGYAKHYVVRDPRSGDTLGFCATYLSYVDKEGERLIASLALLFVRSTYRQQGIGLSLHNHAVSQLKRTRGVMRLQLGSMFPRMLYGPLDDMPGDDMLRDQEWFRRRGWQLNKDHPGQGQAVYDLILDFADWRYLHNLTPQATLRYRPCTQQDMVSVLALVEQDSIRHSKMCWFDQYSVLMNDPSVKDIMLGVENDVIIATALTYTPSCGSPIASNLPWAATIGSDTGGVACICIYHNSIDLAARQDGIFVGLLDACVKKLQEQGMRKMFMDGVTSGLDNLLQLGFEKWAIYKDVWKDT